MSYSACQARFSKHVTNYLLASTVSLVALAIPHVAAAQTAAPAADAGQSGQGNEIIVTARKESETLQEVPVTIAVVGGKTISEYHIDHVADVVDQVPTLSVQVGGSGSGGQLSLRGIGSSAISAAFDSAIAFDYDGIQVSTMRMVQSGFFDTAQIEVLKGPQSLYFGKSSTGGVLAIKSADPTPTWQAEARASYEFQKRGWLVGGYLSGPLTDSLGIRIAAQYNDITRNITLQPGTPAVHPFRGLRDFIGRLTLNFTPSDQFTANLKVQYTRDTNDGAIGQERIYCGANGTADAVYLFSGAVAFPAGYDCNGNSKPFLPDTAPALAGSVPKPSGAVGFNGVPFGKTDLFFSRLRWDLKLSDTLKLTSTSGYLNLSSQDVDNYSYGGVGPAYSPIAQFLDVPSADFFAANFPALAATNAPGTPAGVGTSDPVNKLAQFSQELRLASDFKGPVNFLIGAYYESRRFEFRTSQNAVNISFIAPDPVTGYTFDYTKDQVTKTDAYSLFGSIRFNPIEKLEISGGARYTKENKTSSILIPYMHAFLVAAGFAPSGFFSGPIKYNTDNVSPEVTVKYQISDDLNIFTSFKTGYKSGGIDNSALPSNQLLGFASPDPAVRAATGQGLIFGSEKAKGGEIGFKSQFSGRTITLNGTAFYYVFDGLQVQNFNPATVQFVTLNAGQVTTKGVDIEARWHPPVQGLLLSGNLSYLVTKFTKDFVTPGADGILGTADDLNLLNRTVANAPRWSGNLAFDYSTALSSDLQLGLGGNLIYSSSYFTANTTPTDYRQNGFATYDARISFGATNDRWTISLVGKNIGNKYYAITSGGRPFLAPPNPYGAPVGDDVILNQNQGRQVFVELKVHF